MFIFCKSNQKKFARQSMLKLVKSCSLRGCVMFFLKTGYIYHIHFTTYRKAKEKWYFYLKQVVFWIFCCVFYLKWGYTVLLPF